jgi:hypothetical protein
MPSKQTPRQEVLGWVRFERQGCYILGDGHNDNSKSDDLSHAAAATAWFLIKGRSAPRSTSGSPLSKTEVHG